MKIAVSILCVLAFAQTATARQRPRAVLGAVAAALGGVDPEPTLAVAQAAPLAPGAMDWTGARMNDRIVVEAGMALNARSFALSKRNAAGTPLPAYAGAGNGEELQI